ncbi:hypothetical protein [Micromonospora mirobrigensis]|uniref:Uncharacterized protein n=1 Tax=Micromonospora mirobrigensis TaxID=262898 RepID=A0A1C5AEQ2_9ACTN|nr:hypothetical protein [Micromonospora mirobrigensis]SCF43708.1 hypothetical protein GA0070564_109147 [Micromonospora mirobrigensis]
MNQQVFDEFIGTPPPSTVDVDRIIERQRRGSLLRRAAGAGSALAVAGVAVSVGVALGGGAGPRPAPPAAAPTVPVSAVPSASASAAGLRLDPSSPQAIQRTLDGLRVALEEAVAGAAPDVRWIYMPDVPGEKRLPDGHPAMRAERDPVGFVARSGLARRGGKAGLYMWVRPSGCGSPGATGSTSCSPPIECDDSMEPGSCHASTTPDGLEVVETTETTPARAGGKYRFYQVQVKLPQGYHLRLLAVNYFGGDGSAVSTATPLLTRAELRSAATAVASRVAR